MAGLEMIGSAIARLRQSRGWSRGQFAAMIGKSSSWLAKVETGERKLGCLDDLQTIADALGMTGSDLIAAAEQDNDVLARLPKPAQALAFAVTLAAARAYDKPPSLSLDDAARHLAQARQHLSDARPVDAAGVLADPIAELEHAAAITPATAADGQGRTHAVLTEAYQVAALILSHVGAHMSARTAAEAATVNARGSGTRPITPALTYACVLRRGNRPIQATLMAETVLRAVDAAGLGATATGKAIRGAARLELAALAAQSGDTTTAHAHLTAAAEDAHDIPTDIELPGGIWFGPTMVAIRQLDVAIATGDTNLALTIAARLNTANQTIMAKARARMYIASAHGLVGNIGAGARLIAEIIDMAPQLINDPVVERLLKTFYRTHTEDRRQLTQIQPRNRTR